MRRAVLALVAVLVLSIAGFIGLPMLESRRLGEELLKDVAAQRARVIGRGTPVQMPIHDNGFQCLAGVLKVTPRDLSPFDNLDPSSPLGPWVRGEQPMSAMPEDLKKKIASLGAWGDNLRSCGSSRELRFVPGVEPWDGSEALLRASIALSQLTIVEVRGELEAGKPVDASLRCQATLSAAFDLTHLNSAGLFAALGTSRQVLQVCAAALNALPPEVRNDAAQTWMALLPRVVAIRELLETIRVESAVRNFGPLTKVEGLPPPAPKVLPDTAIDRFSERRLWPKWDKAFRALVDAPDEAARVAAAKRVSDLCEGGSGLPMLPVTLDVATQEGRLKDLTDISLTLTWLAGGAAGKPPVGQRTGAGLVLLQNPVTIPLNP